MRVWVNFKVLRSKLKFAEVLKLYGITPNCRGNQHHGPCPLPGHTGRRDVASFSANLEMGMFQCFGCGAKGNVLEFAVLMAGGDPKDGMAIRKVAVELQTRFFPEGTGSRTKPESRAPTEQPTEPAKPKVLINAPLDFSLKDLDTRHPYLLERRLDESTIAHFGLGVCFRGMMKGQLAIPLHNDAGNLVGYAGRPILEDDRVRPDRGYTFPKRRERNGVVLDFDRTALLYNCDRVPALCGELVVVQWFSSVWWLHQCGFPHAVAVMGSECSERQLSLILGRLKPAGRVIVLADADEDGDRFAGWLVSKLVRNCFVRWVGLKSGSRPTDHTPEELSAQLTS